MLFFRSKHFPPRVLTLALIALSSLDQACAPPGANQVTLAFPQAPVLFVGSAEKAGCSGAPPNVSKTISLNATLAPAGAKPPTVSYTATPPDFAFGSVTRTLASGNTSITVTFTPTGMGPIKGTFGVGLPQVRAVLGPSSLALLGLGTCKGTDTDGDGILDLFEDRNHNGRVDPGESDPKKYDTDGDGIFDGTEDANQNGTVDAGELDPTKTDTDGDGIPDNVEDANGNGKVDRGETDGTKADTDGDGIPDGTEDANKNGKVDAGESDPRNPASPG